MKCVMRFLERLFGPEERSMPEKVLSEDSGEVTEETAVPLMPGESESEPTPEEVPMPTKIPEPTRKDLRIENGSSSWAAGMMPDVIIMHYSAGFNVAGCFAALSRRGLSVHASVERDGVLYEHRKWSERALHAGYGVWRGRQDINQRAFGVEVINLGWLSGSGDGSDNPKVSGLKKWGPPEDELVQGDQEFYRVEGSVRVITKTPCSRFKDHRDAWASLLWSEYTEAQKQTTLWLAWDWISWTAQQNNGEPTIPIENVVGHEHVQGWNKSDPGPAFFWVELYDYLIERAREELPILLDPTWNIKARVAALQSHVHRLDIEIGSIDGVWGEKTQAGIEEALKLFGPVYDLGDIEVKPENTLALCRAFVQIPGFNPQAADHGGISDDLSNV